VVAELHFDKIDSGIYDIILYYYVIILLFNFIVIFINSDELRSTNVSLEFPRIPSAPRRGPEYFTHCVILCEDIRTPSGSRRSLVRKTTRSKYYILFNFYS